jgi:hypothetical protein
VYFLLWFAFSFLCIARELRAGGQRQRQGAAERPVRQHAG